MKKLLLSLVMLLAALPCHAAISCPGSMQVGRDGLGTSSAVNTTGATLFYVAITGFSTDATVTDSNSNTYSYTTVVGTSGIRTRVAYVFGPTTSASTTFTLSGSGTFPAGAFQGCSGTVTSNGLGTVITGQPTSSPSGAVQCGNISPSAAGDLIVSVLGSGGTFTSTINQGFSTPFIVGAGSNEESGESFLATTNSSSVNPTCSTNKNSINFNCTSVVFKTATPISSNQAHTWVF